MRENPATPLTDDCPAHLRRAADYIQDHFAEDLSLEKLALVACYSKYHFHRRFHEHFGETVNDCIRRVRLEKAAYKLKTDRNASMDEIAVSCGFSSSQNFARAFRAHFGSVPSSVRKNPARHVIVATAPFPEPPEKKPPLTVEIIEEPSRLVACIRDIGPYRSESNDRAIERLFQWAFAAGYADTSAGLIGVYWSDFETTPPQECIFDACLTVPENVQGDGEVGIRTLRGGKLAVAHFEDTWERIPEQRKRLFSEWLPASGYQRDERPFFCIYYNNPHMNRRKLAIVDLCLPLKP